MSSFSDSVKTRDQLELSHSYGSSGLRYPIHAPKLAAGRATGGTLRSTIISRTFFHIKVTNQMCFGQFWCNTLETKTPVMQTWHVKFVYYLSHENKMNYYCIYIYVTVVSVGTIGNRLLSM